MPQIRLFAVAAILFGAIAGCAKDNLPLTFDVTGIVEHQGRPVDGATVTLVPSEPNGRSASGITDADGKFSVVTYLTASQQPAGALPGAYSVTVSKLLVHQLPEGLSAQDAQDAFAKMGPQKNLLPKKYASPNTSPFQVEITDSEPEPLVLNLEG
ncbi:carboxypeptidase-like regulatory domain-containing protein [Blastopirellula marina]|uniref:Carboxypeptidase regulatory-like domain-containing protein n=1 Tax=Blastopirellula marina DSM 3645 TaxID=314230 RepID=A4A231_9BACT|nr:carboxypeptidase-like regulatory domain-containing protein [Blastopirellula marina]EAQ77202.1 hypothetical protein DSM3645_13208 [Blastopirellula marina DSM 3645]